MGEDVTAEGKKAIDDASKGLFQGVNIGLPITALIRSLCKQSSVLFG